MTSTSTKKYCPLWPTSPRLRLCAISMFQSVTESEKIASTGYVRNGILRQLYGFSSKSSSIIIIEWNWAMTCLKMTIFGEIGHFQACRQGMPRSKGDHTPQHLSSILLPMSHCPLVFWCQKSKHTSQIRLYLLHWYRNWKLAISHDWQLFTIRPVFWLVGGDHGRWQGHQGGWVGGPGGSWQDGWAGGQGKKIKKVVFYALIWREEWAEGLVWTCILSRWPTRRLSSWWRRWPRSPWWFWSA